MRVNVELNVSDVEFYNVMIESLKEEVKRYAKKGSELKEGIQYKKPSSQRSGIGSKITVTIKKLIPNQMYVASFKTAIDYTEVSYEITRLKDSKIRVTYEEKYENVSNDKIPAWRQKMAEKQSAKKTKKMLKEVETFILSKRDK